MLVRDRVPNYSLAEKTRALAALPTELMSEASLMRKHLGEVLDWISQAVLRTEEAMWHVTAYGNAGLCKTGSRPAVAVSLCSVTLRGTSTAVGKSTAIDHTIPQQPPGNPEGYILKNR